MSNKYEIRLGVQLDTSDIQDQIRNAGKSIKPIEIKIDAETKELTQTIKDALKDLSSGTKNALTLDTTNLEHSLQDVREAVVDIKEAFGSLKDKSGFNSLLSSVNQIATTIGKVTDETDTLVKSLNALSKKEFGFNFNLKTGNANPVKAMTDYGREARRNTIPQLQQQSAYLQDLLGGYQEADKALERYLVKMHKASGISIKNSLIDDMSNTDSIAKQMEAIEKYIGYLKQIATTKGIKLDDFDAQFSKSAENIIDDTVKIQTGAKQTEEALEAVGKEMKQIFGGGVSAEGLSASLQPIITDLGEIRRNIEGLSKNNSIDGLTQSFNRLSETLERLTSNLTLAKNSLDTGFSNSNAVKSAEQLGRKIGDAVEKSVEQSINIDDVNEILGQTIDLSHGAEAAFGDLVNKVNSTKGSKFLTGDDLFRSGILDMGDVVANVSTSLEEIENAEEKIAQASVASANTVVQNEERKQQVIKQTDDAIDSLSNKKTANIGLENVESDLKEITVVADNAEDVIEAMDNALNHLGVGSAGADAITRDIQEMGIEISKVTTKINGSNLEMSITGIQKTADGLERVVTETKRYKDAVSNVENINKTFSQSFETSTDAAKKLEKETTAAFKKLKSLAQDMGKIDIEISGFEANGEIDKANSLKRVLNDLESEFKDLYAVTEKNLSLDQIKDLDKIFANTTGEVREFKNELAKASEAKELTSGLERLKSITKEIAGLRIDIFKFDDADNIERATNKLNELENEAAELRVELQKKFPTASFDEIDDIAKKGEKALFDLINKAVEAKTKLAESIKLDIEVGKFDDGISKMKNNFNSLSGASKELYESVEKVERAYREMEQAAGLNDDEVIDTERLIKAQKEYADALEKTNNLIRIQAREEKAKNDAQKLNDDIGVFQQKIDTWLTKNSAATKQFGNAMLNLKAQAEGCDRVTLNHLEKEFKRLDSAADKTGLKVESLTDRLKSKFKEYAAYLSAAEIFMYVEQALRDMFEQVVAIDTAMTELKKVTDETDASYDKFLTNAASRAKEIGTTIDGLVESTADFARLGYGFEDAQGLAEVANIYAVVGDEVEGVEGATESLISTMAAFKDEMGGMSNSDFAMSIIDSFNELGNNFAISSGGLGEALERSASSLAAANNTIHESAALITAANTVVQNPEKVGNAMKTKFLNCLCVQKCA